MLLSFQTVDKVLPRNDCFEGALCLQSEAPPSWRRLFLVEIIQYFWRHRCEIGNGVMHSGVIK